MAKLFFSYSHRDSDLRDELEIHLAALKREGVIETWHDRKIGAGKEFDNEISQHGSGGSGVRLQFIDFIGREKSGLLNSRIESPDPESQAT